MSPADTIKLVLIVAVVAGLAALYNAYNSPANVARREANSLLESGLDYQDRSALLSAIGEFESSSNTLTEAAAMKKAVADFQAKIKEIKNRADRPFETAPESEKSPQPSAASDDGLPVAPGGGVSNVGVGANDRRFPDPAELWHVYSYGREKKDHSRQFWTRDSYIISDQRPWEMTLKSPKTNKTSKFKGYSWESLHWETKEWWQNYYVVDKKIVQGWTHLSQACAYFEKKGIRDVTWHISGWSKGNYCP